MALHNNPGLFQMVAKYPQAGVHERFGGEFQMAIEYVGSQVHQCRRAVESYLEENSRVGAVPQENDYAGVMGAYVNSLLLYGMFTC